jgi:hypothetical protein
MEEIESLDRRCPFCGSRGIVAYDYSSDHYKHIWVGCSNPRCFCGMRDKFIDINASDEEIQKRWVRDSKKEWNKTFKQDI